MLYTILDETDIFYADQKLEYSYKTVEKCILQGVKCNKDVVLSRIISTNLKDYLNPSYQIGQKITLISKDM